MKKSQVSIEFVFFVGAAFVLLLIYLIISYNYLDLTFKRKDILSSIDILEILRNEINLASRVENSYVRIITIPSKINNQEYNLGINNREINVNFQGVDYARLLATNASLDRKSTGELYIKPGDKIFIAKVNEAVYIDKTCTSNEGDVCSMKYPNLNCVNGCLLKCDNGIRVFNKKCDNDDDGLAYCDDTRKCQDG